VEDSEIRDEATAHRDLDTFVREVVFFVRLNQVQGRRIVPALGKAPQGIARLVVEGINRDRTGEGMLEEY